MSYAVRNDGAGWRAVDGPDDCIAGEHWQDCAPDALPPAQVVPTTVTAVQAFTALDQAGHLAKLLAYLDAPDTPPLVRAVVMGAIEWQRDSLLLMAVAIVLGLTPEQVDDLFSAAALIEV